MNRSEEIRMKSSKNTSRFAIENNVLKGREVSYQDDHASLGEFVLRTLIDNPDLVGQVDVVTGEEYTCRWMRERSVRCALWMLSHGLRPGDVVALCCNDHPDFAMVCFAALYLGAVFSPLEMSTDAESFYHRMNVVKPKMIFVGEDLAAVAVEAAEKAELDPKIIAFGHAPGFLEFDAVIGEPGIDEVEKFGCVPIFSSDEIAAIIFSSGTTGLPKGVALSHRGLTMLTHQAEALGMAGSVCFTFTATYWIVAIESMLMTLLLKIPRMILPPFEERSACAAIEKYKASWVFLFPSMINGLLKSDVISKYDLSSLTQVLYSGSSLPAASRRAFTELLPKVQITSGYGTTECCSYISVQSAESHPGSCGQILENVQVKVIDPGTGRTLGTNENGELLLKFAAMMNGYYNNPQATAEAIDEEGWLHSGDLGYYNQCGEIFVIDRLKDIIRCADEDISPSEIEHVILSHPGVKEVAVVGQPQPLEDDLPIAFVVRSENSSATDKQVTETEIIDLVAAELPDSRRLRAGIRFIDHIPKTGTNKIQRIKLRDLARSVGTVSSDCMEVNCS